MNIYVGNLPYNATEEQLRNMFSQHGEVSSASIIKDRDTGRSKGFGFVEMPDDSAAEEAIQALNESDMNGRNIKVNQARPKEERPRGGDRGGYRSDRGGDRGGYRGGDRGDRGDRNSRY
jgi:RNA recognition motif-containing protein